MVRKKIGKIKGQHFKNGKHKNFWKKFQNLKKYPWNTLEQNRKNTKTKKNIKMI